MQLSDHALKNLRSVAKTAKVFSIALLLFWLALMMVTLFDKGRKDVFTVIAIVVSTVTIAPLASLMFYMQKDIMASLDAMDAYLLNKAFHRLSAYFIWLCVFFLLIVALLVYGILS